MQTSLYDATQGRNGGGNVNAVLRGGGADFHGSLFEYFRNDALNANDFFFNAAGQPRPEMRQNIFGGSVGGPVGHKGAEGFFFLNYQGTQAEKRNFSGNVHQHDYSDDSRGPLAGVTGHDAAAWIAGSELAGSGGSEAAEFQEQSIWRGGRRVLAAFAAADRSDAAAVRATIAADGESSGDFQDDQFTLTYDKPFQGGKDTLRVAFFFQNFHSDLPFGAGALGSQFGAAISPTDLDFPVFLPVHDRFRPFRRRTLFRRRW